MTRKDCVLLAKAIKEAKLKIVKDCDKSNLSVEPYLIGINTASYEIANICSKENSRFNKVRFFKDCSLTE